CHSPPNSSHTSRVVFFVTPPAPPAIYTLSLHDALPISEVGVRVNENPWETDREEHRRFSAAFWHARQPKLGSSSAIAGEDPSFGDRKSTRLNSSHDQISYAVFCLKKKKKTYTPTRSATR